MQVLIAIIFALHLAYHWYKRGKRGSRWSWPRFVILIAAIGVFVPAFMLPLLASKVMEAHPKLMLATMFGGTLIAFGVMFCLLYRKYLRGPAE